MADRARTRRAPARVAPGAGAAVVVLLALGACGVGGPGPGRAVTTAATTGATTGATTAAVAGGLPADVMVDVEVAQARSDRVARVVELRVHNTGTVGLTVTGARLTSAFVTGEAATTREVGTGRTRPVRVPLGAAVCGPDVGDDPRAQVELDVTTVDGRSGTLVVTPTDETDDLRRIHAEDCAAAAVAAGLRLTLADGLTVRDVDGEPVADVTLVLEPVPGGPHVRIVSVRATTLLRPWGATGLWPLDVDSAAPPPDGRVVLATVPARCDLHAIAEDKRGTVLGVQAVVDGVEQPLVHVAASDGLRGALYDYVLDACGHPTDARTG